MFSESDLIAPIWLALCSHYVIGHSTTNQVPGLFRPAAASASPDSAVFVHAEVKTSVHFPHLPEFIGFSNDAVLLGRNAASSTQGDRLGAVWNHPLEATYESTVQVYGELALPSAFEIKKYSPSTPNEKAHLRYVIAGRVAEVSASVHLSDFLPHVPVVIAVSDYRHVGDLPSSINIFTRQGQWPSVEAVRATKEYSEVRKRVVSGQSKHGLTRTTILFSLAALSIPLGVLVWKMKLQKAK